MWMIRLWIVCTCASGFGSAGDSEAQVASRDCMIARCEAYRGIPLSTNCQMDHECLVQNLLRSEYEASECNGNSPHERHSSDILWHPEFLDGQLAHICWWGMPYAYGGGTAPDQSVVQAEIDNCKGIGNHRCHYEGAGCGFPGCDWSVGVDCSGAASHVWGVAYHGSCDLGPGHGVPISKANLDRGSILSLCGVHVAIFASWNGQDYDLYEATGVYPVFRLVYSAPHEDYASYAAYDSKHVVDNQAADGNLSVCEREGRVELAWRTVMEKEVRWFEFQRSDSPNGPFHTISERLNAGQGDYRHSDMPGPGVWYYQVCETDDNWRRTVHGAVKAHLH
jgi:hypothetical protein